MVAEATGRLPQELSEQLSVDQLWQWGEWFRFKAEEEKKAVESVKRDAALKNGRR